MLADVAQHRFNTRVITPCLIEWGYGGVASPKDIPHQTGAGLVAVFLTQGRDAHLSYDPLHIVGGKLVEGVVRSKVHVILPLFL